MCALTKAAFLAQSTQGVLCNEGRAPPFVVFSWVSSSKYPSVTGWSIFLCRAHLFITFTCALSLVDLQMIFLQRIFNQRNLHFSSAKTWNWVLQMSHADRVWDLFHLSKSITLSCWLMRVYCCLEPNNTLAGGGMSLERLLICKPC